MKLFKIAFLVVVTFGIVACQNETEQPKTDADQIALPHSEPVDGKQLSEADLKKIANAKGKTVEAVTFSALQEILANTGDELIVCNFWATWCKPCIEEMPYFEKLQDDFESKKVRVLFVSMDNPKMRETRVTTFIREKQIRSEVVLLDEPNMSQDEWITALNPNWQGDIPATIFVKSNQKIRGFYAGAFEDYEDLKKKIESYL